jgi:hypothetical protein
MGALDLYCLKLEIKKAAKAAFLKGALNYKIKQLLSLF